MSFWSALGDAYKGVVGAVEGAGQWFERQVSDAGDWFEGVLEGHPDAQAMSIAEIVKAIHSGPGSSGLYEAAQVASDQMSKQVAISDGSNDLVQRLESAWSGQAADAARANIRPLAVSADDASRTLSLNGQHIQAQADDFDRIKNSLQLMAEPAPEKNWYDDFVPFSTDAEKAVDQYNQQARQNQQIYDQYHQNSTAVSQAIQIDYGQLPDAQDAQVSTFQLDNSQPGQGGTPNYPGPGSTVGGGPSQYRAPAGAANYSLPAAAAHPTTSPVGSPPSYSSSPPPPPPPMTTGYNDGTTTAGYDPVGNNPNYPTGGVGSAAFGPARGGGYGPAGGFAAAGFGPMGGGFGGTGGFGGAGGGAGRGSGYGAGAQGPLQAGNRVGAGGGGYAARSGPASAAAGATGAAGRPGMSGMGGAHGKGEGGEDEEHETKYLLSEDGDETFGTDEKTAPPVIGL